MATIDPITGEVIEDPLDPALTLPPPEPVLTATEPLAEPVLTDTTTTTTEPLATEPLPVTEEPVATEPLPTEPVTTEPVATTTETTLAADTTTTAATETVQPPQPTSNPYNIELVLGFDTVNNVWFWITPTYLETIKDQATAAGWEFFGVYAPATTPTLITSAYEAGVAGTTFTGDATSTEAYNLGVTYAGAKVLYDQNMTLAMSWDYAAAGFTYEQSLDPTINPFLQEAEIYKAQMDAAVSAYDVLRSSATDLAPPPDPTPTAPPSGGEQFDPLRTFNTSIIPLYSDIPLMPEAELEILINDTISNMGVIYDAGKGGGESPGYANEWEQLSWQAGHDYYLHLRWAEKNGFPIDAAYLASLDQFILDYSFQYVQDELNALFNALTGGTTPPPDDTTVPPPDGTTPPPDGTTPPPDGGYTLPPLTIDSYRVSQEVTWQGEEYIISAIDRETGLVTIEIDSKLGIYRQVPYQELSETVRTGQNAATESIGEYPAETQYPGQVEGVASTAQAPPIFQGLDTMTSPYLYPGNTFFDEISGSELTIIGYGHAPGTYRVKWGNTGQVTDLEGVTILQMILLKAEGQANIPAYLGSLANYAGPGNIPAAGTNIVVGGEGLVAADQVFPKQGIAQQVATGFSAFNEGRGLTSDETGLMNLVSSMMRAGNYNVDEIAAVIGKAQAASGGGGAGGSGGGAVGEYLGSPAFASLANQMRKDSGAPAEEKKPLVSKLKPQIVLPGSDNSLYFENLASGSSRLRSQFEDAMGRASTYEERFYLYQLVKSTIAGSGRTWARGVGEDIPMPTAPEGISDFLKTLQIIPISGTAVPGYAGTTPGGQPTGVGRRTAVVSEDTARGSLAASLLEYMDNNVRDRIEPIAGQGIKTVWVMDEEGGGPVAVSPEDPTIKEGMGEEFELWLSSRNQPGLTAGEEEYFRKSVRGDPGLAGTARKLDPRGYSANLTTGRIDAFLASKYGIPFPVNSNYLSHAVNIYVNSTAASGDKKFQAWVAGHQNVVAEELRLLISKSPEYGVGNAYDLASNINAYLYPVLQAKFQATQEEAFASAAQIKSAIGLGATPSGLASKDPYDTAIAKMVKSLDAEYEIQVELDPTLEAKGKGVWMTARLNEMRPTIPTRQSYRQFTGDSSGRPRTPGGRTGMGGIPLKMQQDLMDMDPATRNIVMDQLQSQIGRHQLTFEERQRTQAQRASRAVREFLATGTAPSGMTMPSDFTRRMMGLGEPQDLIGQWMSAGNSDTFEDYLDNQLLQYIVPAHQVTVFYEPRHY